jgi:diguanylate cyclase (GGDEF)-like protein
MAHELVESVHARNKPVLQAAAMTASSLRLSEDRSLHILSQLQTSLEAEKVVELFAEECLKIIPYDSICYKNPVEGISVKSGRRARHSCSYRLVAVDDALGRITLTRSTRFRDDELLELEDLLVTLVYPLRNAIMYRRALQSALKDPLTGCYNRSAMDTALEREFSLAHREKTPLSLLVLDIDNFKAINDSYGHAVGDAVIKSLAECIASCARKTDILSRFGGEEFSLLLHATDREGAVLLAGRICDAVRATHCRVKGIDVRYTVSIGVATLGDERDEKVFLDKADMAMYEAKRNGRDRVYAAD